MSKWRYVFATVALGAAGGVAAAVSQLALPIVAGAMLLGLILLRTADFGALFVGAYWVTFAVKSVIFTGINIEGLFFPFYGAFLLAVAGALVASGLKVVPTVFWSVFTFLAIVAASFVGFEQPIDGVVTQKIVALLICPLVALSIQSRMGLNLVSAFAALAGLSIAIWIIVNSAIGGFQYRGDVDVNENVAAFVLGSSLVVVIALFLAPKPKGGVPLQLLLLMGNGVMAYALLLLASRGMTIALAAAAAAIATHVVSWHRRAFRTVLALLMVMSGGLLLPGGTGLLSRFEGESVDSAGDRTPIWAATLEALTESNSLQLLLGHGFNSSKVAVQDATAIHTSTHNAFLSMAYDYGLLGLLAFLALHAVVLIIAAGMRNIYSTIAVGLTWLLLGSNMTATTPDDFMYWLVLGFAMACVSFGWASRTQSLSTGRANEPACAV